MCNDITLKRSYLLDGLVENCCLTENEATDILQLKNRKDQTRKLAITIGKRGRTKFSLFLEVLKRTDNYPHIAEKLESSYNARAEENRRRKECIYCHIIQNVNMRDIIDILCSHKIVDLTFLDEVISCDDHDIERWKNLWKRLINGINKARLGTSLEIFQESLKQKHEHISSKLSKGKKIVCICQRKGLKIYDKMSWPSGSCTTEERSTTSTTFIKSQASAKSGIGAISENSSVISNDEVHFNHPRTNQWVESIPIDMDANFFENDDEGQTQFFEAAEENQNLGTELPTKKEKMSTLLDIVPQVCVLNNLVPAAQHNKQHHQALLY
uniref:CARD domain-containing protein n=1 Tax=Magallana gigas TaxID=29159 RepID=A0A8W8L197_MAGGI